MDFRAFIDLLVMGFELVGVLALVVGAIWTVVTFARSYFRDAAADRRRIVNCARGLGAILLAWVAGGGRHHPPVAVDPSFQSVGVLGLIVVV